MLAGVEGHAGDGWPELTQSYRGKSESEQVVLLHVRSGLLSMLSMLSMLSVLSMLSMLSKLFEWLQCLWWRRWGAT